MEFDGLDRVRRSHGNVLGLISLDQRDQDIQSVTLWGTDLRIGLHQGADFLERGPVFGFDVNRADVHIVMRSAPAPIDHVHGAER